MHDLPLWADKEKGIINIFIEIPRGTHAKLEAHKTKPFNPITQDVKVCACFSRGLPSTQYY